MSLEGLIVNLVSNYLNQVTAYAKKRYNPAALAQYNELVAHINAMASVGLFGENPVPADAYAILSNLEQIKYANLPLYDVITGNDGAWEAVAYPVAYAT